MTTPLQKAARDLILRWDSPYWKDQPGTAHFLGELRKALDAAPPQVLEPGPTTRPLTPEEAEMMQSLGVTGKCVRVLAFNDRPTTGDRASLISRADASVTALNSRIMEPFYCSLDQDAARVLSDCVDMLEADAQLHTEIADSRRYIWDMKTSHSKEMRELLLAGSPVAAMNPAEVMSIAYDTGCMPEQCTDASLLRFAHVIRVQAQQVAVPDGWVLVPIEPTQEMISAGQDLVVHDTAYEDYRGVYKAMIAAAQGAKP